MHTAFSSQAAHQMATLAHFHNPSRFYIHAAVHQLGYKAAFRWNIVIWRFTQDFLSLLGVDADAEDLVLASQGQHIYERRKTCAERIIRDIPVALARIRYIGWRQKTDEHTVVGRIISGKLLLVGIKFVPASGGSKRKEGRVTTAHFLRVSELRRCLRKRALRPVFGPIITSLNAWNPVS